jgi:ABC-type multidrug transport system permease subunit
MSAGRTPAVHTGGDNAMILRAMGLGFVLWLAVAAVFRLLGQHFFLPDEQFRLYAFLSAPVIGVIAAILLLKLLREAHGDEGEASIGVALPTMFLNGVAAHEFPRAFPNLDPTLDATFGAWTLLFAASILFTGLSMTQLAPKDERV